MSLEWDHFPWAWFRRDKDVFGGVRSYNDGRQIPVVGLRRDRGTWDRWTRLRKRWLELDGTSAVIDAIGETEEDLLLRYPAIDWRTTKVEAREHGAALASWFVDLIDAYRLLSHQVEEDIELFCSPRLKIDVVGRVRLIFHPDKPDSSDAPPEIRQRAHHWDERSTVYIAAALTRRLVNYQRGPSKDLIARCMARNPDKRPHSIDALVAAIEETFHVDASALRVRDSGYLRFEEGIGWLELADYVRAEDALLDASDSPELRDDVREYLQIVHELRRSQTQGTLHTPSVGFGIPADEQLPRAREALKRNDIGFATSLAHEIRRREPHHREAALILAEAHMRNSKHQDALDVLDALLSRDVDARTCYVRAKVLFAAKRLHEARAGFEQAFKLDPMMLEAMLLRREVDRALASVRATVGESQDVTVRLPAALSDVREVLLSGDAKATIAVLQHQRYEADAEVQLVLARFLSVDGQHDGALEVYDRVTAESHRFTALLGKATTLLELDRTDSALALFDQLVAEKPSDAEASEGRARALEKLGRIGEAAAEYRRFISLATVGSDLRVRAAQDWLDAHPL